VAPTGATYNRNFGEFLLLYEAVRQAAAPVRLFSNFCKVRIEQRPILADGAVANWERV
jgi:hypothetical protein